RLAAPHIEADHLVPGGQRDPQQVTLCVVGERVRATGHRVELPQQQRVGGERQDGAAPGVGGEHAAEGVGHDVGGTLARAKSLPDVLTVDIDGENSAPQTVEHDGAAVDHDHVVGAVQPTLDGGHHVVVLEIGRASCR